MSKRNTAIEIEKFRDGIWTWKVTVESGLWSSWIERKGIASGKEAALDLATDELNKLLSNESWS